MWVCSWARPERGDERIITICNSASQGISERRLSEERFGIKTWESLHLTSVKDPGIPVVVVVVVVVIQLACWI